MVDVILHVLDACSPARVSVWTWTIAAYEVAAFTALSRAEIKTGTLILNDSHQEKHHNLVEDWRDRFGPRSVKHVINHAKIATIEGQGLRVLVRGSMNLNHNARFEQLDITEGGPDFDLVRRVEEELPVLSREHSRSEASAASQTDKDRAVLGGIRLWKK